jgi:hypothetical protein
VNVFDVRGERSARRRILFVAPYPYETEFPSLDLDRPEDGILRLTLRAPGRLNAVSEAQHW